MLNGYNHTFYRHKHNIYDIILTVFLSEYISDNLVDTKDNVYVKHMAFNGYNIFTHDYKHINIMKVLNVSY